MTTEAPVVDVKTVVPMIRRLKIAGWKSIKEAEIELRPLNVLIGANGSGKSNLVAFFRMLEALARTANHPIADLSRSERPWDLVWDPSIALRDFVTREGGAESLLHFGSKTTTLVDATVGFDLASGPYQLRLTLPFMPSNRLELIGSGIPSVAHLNGEANVASNRPLERKTIIDVSPPIGEIVDFMKSCRTYHFHDTTFTAAIRRDCYVHANRYLYADGGNLAAMLYLYRERYPVVYRRIVWTIKSICPPIDEFILEPERLNPNQIVLKWRAKGNDYEFGPHQFSDGTLRFIALCCLLLQPEEDLPRVIVLDEPELGLHPMAIVQLAAIIHHASSSCQVIVATQSSILLDHFSLDDIIVVDGKRGATTFERLSSERFAAWKDGYEISDLWERNVIGERSVP